VPEPVRWERRCRASDVTGVSQLLLLLLSLQLMTPYLDVPHTAVIACAFSVIQTVMYADENLSLHGHTACVYSPLFVLRCSIGAVLQLLLTLPLRVATLRLPVSVYGDVISRAVPLRTSARSPVVDQRCCALASGVRSAPVSRRHGRRRTNVSPRSLCRRNARGSADIVDFAATYIRPARERERCHKSR